MHILHAHFQPVTDIPQHGSFHFWVESHAQQTKKKKYHPFASRDISDALAPLLTQAHTLTPSQLTLWLPSQDTPQPSPQLRHMREAWEGEPTQWTQWHIPTCSLTLPATLTTLLMLPNESDLPTTLKLGSTVQYWQLVAQLTAEVIAGGRMLPGLVSADNTTFHTRWLPILDRNNDATRLTKLRDAMPPLCRTASESLADAPHPTILINQFIEQTVDACARTWTASPNLPSDADELDHRWLRSLFGNPALTGSADQWQHIAGSYRAWTRNLTVSGDTHYRVALTLDAPQGRQRKWRLYYALQAREDPSLIIPADDIWQERLPNTLKHPLPRAQQLLLTGLGYAAQFSTPIRNTLQKAKPTQLTFSGADAYDFLRNAAPLLEASGFGVLVPPWWTKASARLSLKLKLSSSLTAAGSAEATRGIVSMSNLVNYDWQLAIGDTALTREEFDALVALKSPLVQVRGQWVRLDPEQIEAAIRFWDKQQAASNSGNLLDALALGLDPQHDMAGLPVETSEFSGWLGDTVSQLRGEAELKPLPQPDQLNATLRPYQAHGYAWLNFLRTLGIGGILADDMGLGKTIQSLTLFQHIKEQAGTDTLAKPILLICPTSVVTNWDKEREKFTPNLKALLHQGGDRLRDEDLLTAIKEHDLILTSFAIALRDGETLKQVDWLGIVLDEAQNIKNPNAKRTRMIRSFNAEFRFALTGTPIENRLAELWSIMQFLNPNYLGNQKQFRTQFSLPIERYQSEDATKRLRSLTQPFLLRRLKTDPTVISDLPDKQEMKVYVNLRDEQASLYESVVQDTLKQIEEADGIQRRGMVLSLLMKLKQICNHPAQFLHQMGESSITDELTARSGKLERLATLLGEITADNEHALIFTQFTDMGGFLQRYLQEQLGIPTLYLHGGTPPKKRAAMVEQFQEDPNAPPVFILSLKAGGTGLTLTRANHVFHFDRWWNPAVENQATDRAFRIGQKKNVLVHKFITVGTLEEQIDEMITQKQALADSIVGQGENWLTEMNTEDLRKLVQLRKETLT